MYVVQSLALCKLLVQSKELCRARGRNDVYDFGKMRLETSSIEFGAIRTNVN